MIIPSKFADSLTKEQLYFLQSFFLNAPASLEAHAILKTYPKNHILIHTDDICSHIYLLLKGRLQAIEERVADEPYSFTEISAIEIVGDFELFTTTSNRMITLTTLEKSLCLILPANEYLAWIKTDANALFIRTQMLIRQIVAQTQFDRQNFFFDNKTRLLHFLYSECNKQHITTDFLIPYTRSEISGKLGCSVRTINRTVLKLIDEGFISINRGKIQISQEQYAMIQMFVLAL